MNSKEISNQVEATLRYAGRSTWDLKQEAKLLEQQIETRALEEQQAKIAWTSMPFAPGCLLCETCKCSVNVTCWPWGGTTTYAIDRAHSFLLLDGVVEHTEYAYGKGNGECSIGLICSSETCDCCCAFTDTAMRKGYGEDEHTN